MVVMQDRGGCWRRWKICGSQASRTLRSSGCESWHGLWGEGRLGVAGLGVVVDLSRWSCMQSLLVRLVCWLCSVASRRRLGRPGSVSCRRGGGFVLVGQAWGLSEVV